MGSVSPHGIRTAASSLYKPAANTAAASMTGTSEAVLGTHIVNRNELGPGSIIRVAAGGYVSDGSSGSASTTYRVRIGPTTLTGTEVLVSAALDPETNEVWSLQAWIVIYDTLSAVGGGICFQGQASQPLDDGTTDSDAASIYRMTPTALDISLSQRVEVTAQFSGAGDTTDLDYMIVDVTPTPFETF